MGSRCASASHALEHNNNNNTATSVTLNLLPKYQGYALGVLTLTSAGVDEVKREIIRTVLYFELVEEDSDHLRRPHAAVDSDVCHRAVGRSEHCCLREQRVHSFVPKKVKMFQDILRHISPVCGTVLSRVSSCVI